MVDCVSVRFKNARVEKLPLKIRIQWNAGTACVCVPKMLACRGLRVGPSTEPKTQIFAENRRFSHIHPFCWKFERLEGAGKLRETNDFGRKPKILAENSETRLIRSTF